jgi:GT2 family glycosyltransferase
LKVSLIIPLFNYIAESKAMLASLLATVPAALEYEVVLVDDGSTDGTREWAASLEGLPAQPGLGAGVANQATLRVVLNEHNAGFARACMAGVKASSGEVLGFLNNDLLLSAGWLQAMWEPLMENELLGPASLARRGRVGVVGNVQHRLADGALDHAGVALTPRGQFKHLRELPADASPVQHALAVTGACILVRRADFLAVGGFDTRYLNGCEDLDLCFKLRERGLTSVVATRSRIGHHVSLTRSSTSQQNERNSRALFARWRGQIKHELSNQWAQVLREGDGASLAPWLPGRLTDEAARAPHAAARMLAEAALQEQEHRWRWMLDGVDDNAHLASAPWQGEGLVWHPAAGAWAVPTGEAAFTFSSLRSARDFYACGRLSPGAQAQGLELTLCANGVHELTLPLGPEPHVNAGLVSPVVLPGLSANRFTLRITRAHPNLRPHQRPAVGGAVWLTHVVVDGKRVAG